MARLKIEIEKVPHDVLETATRMFLAGRKKFEVKAMIRERLGDLELIALERIVTTAREIVRQMRPPTVERLVSQIEGRVERMAAAVSRPWHAVAGPIELRLAAIRDGLDRIQR